MFRAAWIGAISPAPDRLRAHILGELGKTLMLEDRLQEAERVAREMLVLARRLGDQAHQTDAMIALAQLDPAGSDDSVTALQCARETARRIGYDRLELRACSALTHVLEGRGDDERAIRAGRDGLARAKQLGLARFDAVLAQNLAESLTSAGRWDETLQVVEEALSLDPAPRGRRFLLLLRGQIAVACGEQETAERILQQLRAEPLGVPRRTFTLPAARLVAEFHLAEGDLTGALTAVQTALAHLPAAEPLPDPPVQVLLR